jgi:hypothetical protein
MSEGFAGLAANTSRDNFDLTRYYNNPVSWKLKKPRTPTIARLTMT